MHEIGESARARAIFFHHRPDALSRFFFLLYQILLQKTVDTFYHCDKLSLVIEWISLRQLEPKSLRLILGF